MSFNSKVMIFDAVVFIIGVIIISILNLSIKRDNKDLVESNIKKSCEIRKLNREIDRLNNIIKNNEYNTKLYYKSINYIADDDHELIEADDTIYMAIGYTTDISKAKNFIKDYDSYYEIENEKTEG